MIYELGIEIILIEFEPFTDIYKPDEYKKYRNSKY